MARYLEIAAGAKRGLNWDAYRDTADLEKGVEAYDMRNMPMRGVIWALKRVESKWEATTIQRRSAFKRLSGMIQIMPMLWRGSKNAENSSSRF